MNELLKTFKASLAVEKSYRFRVIVWILSDTIQPLIMAVVWSSVASSGNIALDKSLIISYFLGVLIVSKLTDDWSIDLMTQSILSGEFSKYLLRPGHYFVELIAKGLENRLLRIIILIPVLAIILVIFKSLDFSLNFKALLWFGVSLIIAIALNFLLGNLIALSAFYIKQVNGLKALYKNSMMILSGEMIPLYLLGIGFITWLNWLPFRYTLSFPVEIVIGTLNDNEIWLGLFTGLLWLGITALVYVVSYKFALRNYQGEGI